MRTYLREIVAGDGFCLVELTKGKWAKISPCDAELIGRDNWQAAPRKSGIVYATSKLRGYLHRVIARAAGIPTTAQIDHRNGDGLDCRRENLRAATSGQNKRNSRLRSDNASGIKGVSWNKQHQKWRARVSVNGQEIYVGLFASLELARRRVAAARVVNHGEFANHGFAS